MELPSLSEIAQFALDVGFVPIPIKGKRPILPRWQSTSKEKALRKVTDAEKTNSADNIGIITGSSSGIVVVDVDVNKGGLDFWNELVSKYGEPHTLTVETGSGGLHYYFNYDDKTSKLRNATSAIKGRGIDLKTDGGQVVFAGSIHPDTKKPYQFINGADVDKPEVKISTIPDWLFELLEANQSVLDQRYPKKYK